MTGAMPGLTGTRVLVTASDGGRLAALLRARGAAALAVPTITIRNLAGDPLDSALGRAAGESAGAAPGFDWIVVTSPNGARATLLRLRVLGLSVPARPQWAAVGSATRSALESEGVSVAFVPEEGTGAAIAAGLGRVRGCKILLLRSSLAGPDLPRLLREAGADVEDVAAYETIEGPESSRAALADALADGVDAVIFTSGSTVRGFVRLASEVPARALAGAAFVAIGPVTARVVEAAGLGRARIARDRTPEDIVAAIEECVRVRA